MFLVINCLFQVESFGQEVDTLKNLSATKVDTLKADKKSAWKPVLYGLRVGVDLVYPVRRLINNDLEQYEITADLDLGRFMVVADYGIADYNLDHLSGSLMNISGSYFRVGGDVNFNIKDPRNFVMFVGLRYARAYYDSKFSYNYEDEFFGSVDQTDVDEGVNSRWFELNAGIKVGVLKNVFLGFTGRLAFLNRVNNASTNDAYRVPGYGINDGASWGFNYYVFYRIPFKQLQSNN
ncbi:DUF6048 family protein [Mangrovivirga cuniculi]|uniref:Outer membrane protein beta-barrel domain-containing protein n=1 Tax=Mangrovivirga cuniculi TaxID=2715131 RepID=A0A4D7K2D7_9BACT|nr:DUF6048 family protein [Mangrovivirga cuniculi]QCK13548.1 hypothetical protein DCC35_01655 [Mangrovivirga cuniculi]